MSISATLEVFMGLAFLYLLLSLAATWINEWIAHRFQTRAQGLERAIRNLLKDPPAYIQDPKKYLVAHPDYKPLVERFYGHGIIKALSEEEPDRKAGGTKIKRKPAYVPARTFALVALDVLFPDQDISTKPIDELKQLVEQGVPHPDTRAALLAFLDTGATRLEDIRADMETWFDDTMDRLSGWYKRRAHLLSFAIGLVLAVSLNVDTLVVADALWREPTLRAGVATYVEKHIDEFAPQTQGDNTDDEEQTGAEVAPTEEPTEEAAPAEEEAVPGEEDAVPSETASGEEDSGLPIERIREALTTLELPLGWTTYAPRSSVMISVARDAGRSPVLAVVVGWLLKGVGWFITGLAVSQGAPFWFDLLNKLVNLRSSGTVPPKQEELGEGATRRRRR